MVAQSIGLFLLLEVVILFCNVGSQKHWSNGTGPCCLLCNLAKLTERPIRALLHFPQGPFACSLQISKSGTLLMRTLLASKSANAGLY